MRDSEQGILSHFTRKGCICILSSEAAVTKFQWTCILKLLLYAFGQSSCAACRLLGHLLRLPQLASTTVENQTGLSQPCPKLLPLQKNLAQPNSYLPSLEQCQTVSLRTLSTPHLLKTFDGSQGLLHSALLATFQSAAQDQWSSLRSVANVAAPRVLPCRLPCKSVRFSISSPSHHVAMNGACWVLQSSCTT